MIKLSYLDGLAGSSKTEVMIEDIINKVLEGAKFIYTVPSTAACLEISSRFIKRGLVPKVFFAGYNVGLKPDGKFLPVHHVVEQWLQQPESNVIIITHSAFRQLGEFPKHYWHVVHDETFDPTIQLDLKLPNFHSIVLKYVDIGCFGEEFAPARYIGEESVETLKKKHIFNKDGDIVSNLISDFFQCLVLHLESKGTLYIDTKSLEALKQGTGKVFSGVFIYNPAMFLGYSTVTIISANFKNDLVFNLWKTNFGVEWICRSDLKKKLKFSKHLTPLEVHYVLDSDTNWSKYRAKLQRNDKTVLEYFEDIAREFISSSTSPVLVMGNKGDNILSFPNTVECEFNSQGLNKYMHLRTLVYSGAFNRTPVYYRFMQWFKCEEYVRLAQNSSHLYQTLLRGIVRWNSPDTMRLLIPSLSMFLGISDIFSNITYVPVQGKSAEFMRTHCRKVKSKKLPLDQRLINKKLRDSARAAKFRSKKT